MKKGTVKFYNSGKLFGFISQDGGGPDVFVHKNGLIDSIKEGDKVEFELEETQKGPSAIKVKKVG